MISSTRHKTTWGRSLCRMTYWGAVLIALAGCRVQPDAMPDRYPTLAPPEGSRSYDACAYILHYPPELELQVLPSEDVVLISPSADAVRITFSERELREEEAQNSASLLLEDLIEQVDASVSWAFSPAFVVDAEGRKLEGLRADAVSAGLHWRLFAVIHPAIYFWDTEHTTVAYTMRVQVPVDDWGLWSVHLESILTTFTPIACGPY
jgi:hypothetical protein